MMGITKNKFTPDKANPGWYNLVGMNYDKDGRGCVEIGQCYTQIGKIVEIDDSRPMQWRVRV